MDQTPPGNGSGTTGGQTGQVFQGPGGHGVDNLDIAWLVFAALVVAALIAVGVWAVRRYAPTPRNPLTILDMRLAEGHIDPDTHARLRAQIIHGQTGSHAAPAATPAPVTPATTQDAAQPTQSEAPTTQLPQDPSQDLCSSTFWPRSNPHGN
ncbi:hypothetical protein [Schaalia vaccimaxillae]|uniref:hypothetical protein n=1 Tax=Schaalia vaccimaxillae TaxID=183916 RepID=UPI0003B36E93|nr:hypothetical protein [Schaalia vaccimaxillae]